MGSFSVTQKSMFFIFQKSKLLHTAAETVAAASTQGIAFPFRNCQVQVGTGGIFCDFVSQCDQDVYQQWVLHKENSSTPPGMSGC